MAILPIVTYNDEVLREKAEPVKENSGKLQELIDDMFQTMYNADGVGLAAPQVGELIRLFVADVDVMTEGDEEKEGPTYGPLVMINPEIVSSGDEQVELEEGCLSIPGVNSAITRPDRIRVTYLDREFKEQELELEGWCSRVVQHERDHLDGILFLDYLSTFKHKLLGSKLKEIDDGLKETEYPLAPKKPVAR